MNCCVRCSFLNCEVNGAQNENSLELSKSSIFFEFRLMRYLKTKPIVCVSFWNFKMAWTWCQANPAWRRTGQCYAPFPIGHISFSFCPIYWPVTWPVFYVLVRGWMSPVLLLRYTAHIFWAVSKDGESLWSLSLSCLLIPPLLLCEGGI